MFIMLRRGIGISAIVSINHSYNNNYYNKSKILLNKNNATFVSSSFSSLCDSNSNNNTPNDIPLTLYQYRICPFCHRVRSLLDYMNINYKIIEVDPLTKTELSFSKDYKKVPVAIIKDDIIGDSSKIIKEVISSLYVSNSNNKKLNMKEFLTNDTDEWIEWSEKKLAVMLYPNITRSLEESWETFGYVNDVKEWSLPHRMIVRIFGTGAMSMANSRIKEKYGIKNEREELKQVLNHWVDAVGKKKFLHGDKITVPDLMIYGVLRSINSTRTFNEIMSDNANLEQWYKRVDNSIVSHAM